MISAELLKTNLISLLQHSNSWSWLADLSWNMSNAFIRKSRNGFEITHRKRWVEIRDDYEDHYRFDQKEREEKKTLIIGLGNGRFVNVLLETGSAVTVLEKNPWILLYAFQHYDWSESIALGKLKFEDPFLGRIESFEGFQRALHPVFAGFYRDLLEKRTPSMDVLLEGELLIDDWYDTLQEQGISTYIYPHHLLPQTKIVRDLTDPAVRRVWSINRVSGMEKVAEVIKKPYFIYEIDPDLSEIPVFTERPRFTRVFTYRKKNEAEYNAKGWKAGFLPLGSPSRMKAVPNEKYSSRLSFVGTSMITNAETLTQFLQGQSLTDQQFRLLAEFKDRQKANPEIDLSTSYYDSWKKIDGAEFLVRNGLQVSVRKIFMEWSGMIHRTHLVKAASVFGIHVWGDEAWKTLRKESPGITYRGAAGHLKEVPGIYSSSRINLDITRLYQLDVLTLRVFDVFACQSLCVSNAQAETPIFADPGLLTYANASELLKLLEEIFSWPEKRYQDYVKEMHMQVGNKHMFSHRLRHMLAQESST